MELPGKICALNLHSHRDSRAGVLGWLANDRVYPAGLKPILIKQDEKHLAMCMTAHVIQRHSIGQIYFLYFNIFIYCSILYVYECFT